MPVNFGARLRSACDRRGLRSLWGIVESANLAVHRRGCRLVYFRRGRWLNRFSSVVIPWPTPQAPTPTEWRERAADVFFYDYVPRVGDVVVDVGAGLGSEVLALSELVGPDGLVIAIEPHPRTFSRLADFVGINPALRRNTHLYEVAVSDRADNAFISDEPQFGSNRLVLGQAEGALPVRAITLDELLDREAVQHIDFLKMNIEGAEAMALNGLHRHVERVSHIAVSCHDFRADRGGDVMRTRETVSTLLSEAGFVLRTRPTDERDQIRHYVYGARE